MIDPEEYRDLVEENAMLRAQLKAAKEENTRLKEVQRYPEDIWEYWFGRPDDESGG